MIVDFSRPVRDRQVLNDDGGPRCPLLQVSLAAPNTAGKDT